MNWRSVYLNWLRPQDFEAGMEGTTYYHRQQQIKALVTRSRPRIKPVMQRGFKWSLCFSNPRLPGCYAATNTQEKSSVTPNVYKESGPSFCARHELNVNFYCIPRLSGRSNLSGHKECTLDNNSSACMYLLLVFTSEVLRLYSLSLPALYSTDCGQHSTNVWDKPGY